MSYGSLIPQNSAEIAIIPQPGKLNIKKGSFTVPEELKLCFNEEARASIKWLEALFSRVGSVISIEKNENCGNLSLQVKKELLADLGEEGYSLGIYAERIEISAATNQGLFYGIQTLRQLFPADIEKGLIRSKIKLPQLEIVDSPRFSWRGNMLDISRSFLDANYIRKHIDRMAIYKLNRLHLHLSDDQGWRIELKSFPELALIGGKGSVKNGRSGYLTQKEFRDLQLYAKERNIILIPEIDLPGHTYAALRSMPELNCEDFTNLEPQLATPPEKYDGYKVGWSRLCLENEKTYDFVGKLIKELSEITLGPWIHIGGDEIDHPLYEEFIRKTSRIVAANGKIGIGWEEAAKAELTNDFMIQRWNGETKIKDSRKIIDSYCKYFYLDHGNVKDQENTYRWCKEDGISLEDVYSYENKDDRVIGIEAPVWTELVLSDDIADDRLWPRSIAVAEVGWTKPENKDFENFTIRLAKHTQRLDNLGVRYFRSPEVNWMRSKPTGVFSDLEYSNEN